MEFHILCSENASCSTACWGIPWVNRRLALLAPGKAAGWALSRGQALPARGLQESRRVAAPQSTPAPGPETGLHWSPSWREPKCTLQQSLLRLFIVILTARTCSSRGHLVQKHCRHSKVAAGTAEGKSGAEGPLACCADDSGAPGAVLMKPELNKYLPFCSPFSRLPDIIQKTYPIMSLRCSRSLGDSQWSSAQICKFFKKNEVKPFSKPNLIILSSKAGLNGAFYCCL